MSLWRKRKTSDTVATNVHHNEQNPSDLVNILTNLSIKSEDLSIKSKQKQDNLPSPLDRLHEENVRLGLYEIVYDLSIQSDDLSIKSWVGLTQEEIEDSYNADYKAQTRAIERLLKEKNT